MSASKIKLRRLILFAALAPLVLLFFYVVLRSGPLAPVEVTVTTVSTQAIRPAVFGVGTVEARYSYQVGPTAAGRIKQLQVQVGDRVRATTVVAGQTVIELIDPASVWINTRFDQIAANGLKAGLPARMGSSGAVQCQGTHP